MAKQLSDASRQKPPPDAARPSSAANGANGSGSDSLQLSVQRHFEEALELWLFHVKGEDRTALRVNSCTVELVIDKNPAGKGPDEPPKDAFVKRLEVGGLKQPVLIQNMPSGLSFYTAVVATLPGGRRTRSKWERTRTLPLSEAGRENTDMLGNTRGRCRNCPCKSFRQLNTEVTHINDMNAVSICRRCGCNSIAHEEVWQRTSSSSSRRKDDENWIASMEAAREKVMPEYVKEQQQKEEEARAAAGRDRAKASRAQPPPENDKWTTREKCLYDLSQKQFHPDVMAEKRRALCSIGGKGRVSVCCPTVESRQLFHEQLWNVFHASDWPDKELIVVETYQGSPSPFFTSKAEEDQRVIYLGFQRPRFDDWSIGLKRNMCVHLATGEFIANFDDDDLYAPNYISTMIEAMRKHRSFGVTLSSWYVYDVGCCKMGFVDPQAMCEDPREKENWLYGYGFSYVYTRKAALCHPYPDRNMREDYDFFLTVRNSELLHDRDPLGAFTLGGPRVQLLYDEYGICVHTLHPRSTSHSWAKREVPMDEVLGLDFAELGGILESYFTRFPRTTENSPYIGKFERRADRPLEIMMDRRRFTIPIPAGATAQQVIAIVVSRISALSSYEKQLALFKENPWENNNKFNPQSTPLASGDPIGLRTQVVWVLNETERGLRKVEEEEEPEVEVSVTVSDIEDESASVEFVLPHTKVKQHAVLDKLLEKYANRSEKAKQSAGRLRLAVRAGSEMLIACDLEQKVGRHRQFFARGLADLLKT